MAASATRTLHWGGGFGREAPLGWGTANLAAALTSRTPRRFQDGFCLSAVRVGGAGDTPPPSPGLTLRGLRSFDSSDSGLGSLGRADSSAGRTLRCGESRTSACSAFRRGVTLGGAPKEGGGWMSNDARSAVAYAAEDPSGLAEMAASIAFAFSMTEAGVSRGERQAVPRGEFSSSLSSRAASFSSSLSVSSCLGGAGGGSLKVRGGRNGTEGDAAGVARELPRLGSSAGSSCEICRPLSTRAAAAARRVVPAELLGGRRVLGVLCSGLLKRPSSMVEWPLLTARPLPPPSSRSSRSLARLGASEQCLGSCWRRHSRRGSDASGERKAVCSIVRPSTGYRKLRCMVV